jgi:hypothetical protein
MATFRLLLAKCWPPGYRNIISLHSTEIVSAHSVDIVG